MFYFYQLEICVFNGILFSEISSLLSLIILDLFNFFLFVIINL